MKNSNSVSRPFGMAPALALASALAGCGGGGGGGGVSAPAPVSADTKSPTLAANAAITPASGASGVAYAATVSFTASEALSQADIQLRCDGIAIPGKTTIAGAVATFAPTAPGLAASAQCTATVNGPGTKDMAGNAFASNVTLSSFIVRPLDCPTATSNEAPTYGGIKLVAACGNVFVDPVVPKNLYPGLVALMSSARDTNNAMYGSLSAVLPDLVVCDSNACADYFAGPSRRNTTLPPNTYAGQYVTPRMTVVLTSATWNRNASVLAHELSHVEVSARIGTQHVPAWFDEGLATYVGGEPDCTGVTAKGIADLRTLDLESTWVTYTGDPARFTPTYCQARTEVAAWIAKNGKASVGALLQGVGQGKSFSTLYGGLLTQ